VRVEPVVGGHDGRHHGHVGRELDQHLPENPVHFVLKIRESSWNKIHQVWWILSQFFSGPL